MHLTVAHDTPLLLTENANCVCNMHFILPYQNLGDMP
jgi:hypothetical protein